MKECFDCFNCKYYQAYYIKGQIHFWKQMRGNCRKHNKIVNLHEGCEQWEVKLPDKIHKEKCLKALDAAVCDILQIKQILSKEQEEE